MNKYRLHWLSGNTQIVEGHDIADACNRAGIGGGAIGALDYYENVELTRGELEEKLKLLYVEEQRVRKEIVDTKEKL